MKSLIYCKCSPNTKGNETLMLRKWKYDFHIVWILTAPPPQQPKTKNPAGYWKCSHLLWSMRFTSDISKLESNHDLEVYPKSHRPYHSWKHLPISVTFYFLHAIDILLFHHHSCSKAFQKLLTTPASHLNRVPFFVITFTTIETLVSNVCLHSKYDCSKLFAKAALQSHKWMNLTTTWNPYFHLMAVN